MRERGTGGEGYIIMRKLHVLLIVFALALPSCGYSLTQNTGVRPAEPSAEYAFRVAIPLFVNATFEPLIEKDVTAALQEEIAMDGRLVLTDPAKADHIISGRVLKFALQPLSYDPQERILEYRVWVASEIKVTESKTGKVVYKDVIETYADYRVTDDVTKSKIRREEAIKKAIMDMADEFILKALDVF